MSNWLKYANQGAIRNKPLDPQLVDRLGFIPEMGLAMEVFSGGQDAIGEGKRRTGSVRHDHGGSGDAFFYKDGRKLDWSNPEDLPIFQDIVSRGKGAGITGFGAGPDYMRPGSMHIGMGNPGVWGAGGKGANAPDWLRKSYNGVPGVSLTSSPIASSPVTPPFNNVADGSKGQEVWPKVMSPAPVSAPSPSPAVVADQFPPPPSNIGGVVGGLVNGGATGGLNALTAGLSGGAGGPMGSLAGLLGAFGGGQQQPAPVPAAPNLSVNRGNDPGAAQLLATAMNDKKKRRGGVPGLSLMG